jgi:hypothetical protein
MVREIHPSEVKKHSRPGQRTGSVGAAWALSSASAAAALCARQRPSRGRTERGTATASHAPCASKRPTAWGNRADSTRSRRPRDLTVRATHSTTLTVGAMPRDAALLFCRTCYKTHHRPGEAPALVISVVPVSKAQAATELAAQSQNEWTSVWDTNLKRINTVAFGTEEPPAGGLAMARTATGAVQRQPTGRKRQSTTALERMQTRSAAAAAAGQPVLVDGSRLRPVLPSVKPAPPPGLPPKAAHAAPAVAVPAVAEPEKLQAAGPVGSDQAQAHEIKQDEIHVPSSATTSVVVAEEALVAFSSDRMVGPASIEQRTPATTADGSSEGESRRDVVDSDTDSACRGQSD